MNPVPDFIAKVAYEPSWGGHYEVFGVARFFRARLFPNATAAEIKAGTANSNGAFNDTENGGGVGGSARVPVLRKKIDLGLKGLWGTGVGRYGTSTIADRDGSPRRNPLSVAYLLGAPRRSRSTRRRVWICT